MARRDPTQTTTLRNRFQAEAYRRFRTLKGKIRKAVLEEDGFGLQNNRGNFDFPRTDRKVQAFMAWLREQQRKDIIGIEEGVPVSRAADQAWTATYIRTAYQRGVSHAAKQMRGAGVNVEESWEENAFNRPVHADRLGLAYTRAYQELEGITEAMDQQISRELAQGLAEGQHPRVIARRINDRVDKVGITRARTLARTETISAHAEASLNAYEEAGVEGVDVEAEWSTAGDDRVCSECKPKEGTVRPLDEARGMIPLHPNCLPGDSLVLPRSGVTAASKRWFDGDVVVIRTASGRELTSTPNHPVLTGSGWVGAASLDVGDDVICDGGGEWAGLIDRDDQDIPTPIHDVAESFLGSGEVSASPVPVSAPDFHGDGAGSDVAVVGTDRGLRGTGNPSLLKGRNHLGLKGCIRRALGLLGLGLLTKFVKAANSTASGFVSRSRLLGSTLLAHLAPFNQFGFALAAHTNPVSGKGATYRFAAKGDRLRNADLGLARLVASDNFRGKAINKLGLGHVGISQDADDDLVADSVLAGELASGSAGPVFSDEVVSVERVRFSGHVYNLETVEGWYSANGIITHNCRCAFIPKVKNGTGIELK